jgi:spoIIIJ-associated protein
MPKEIEVEGATVKEAIKKALKQLGVKKEQAIIEILSEEKKGLFGMEGAKPAKIRARLKDSLENNIDSEK